MKGEKKLKKYPSKPKAGASLRAYNNWNKRCDIIDKENKIIADYNKKLRLAKEKADKRKSGGK